MHRRDSDAGPRLGGKNACDRPYPMGWPAGSMEWLEHARNSGNNPPLADPESYGRAKLLSNGRANRIDAVDVVDLSSWLPRRQIVAASTVRRIKIRLIIFD
ncbi:hypothetical protein PCASD_06951 [Puccinia coronata f. sp. avenae]|uniref:Uncharacterized protein n=1 Tax=Puccinia coronata f. sp. avenae TaxID=200324 RepID=A0A2N5V4S1_9BASI|nr:hypothetical protein PCASD_06951 [Puccinia coronata f. sp. avenae]